MHELEAVTIKVLKHIGRKIEVKNDTGYILDFPFDKKLGNRDIPCMKAIEYIINAGGFFEKDLRKWCDKHDIAIDTRYRKGKHKVYFRDMAAPRAHEYTTEHIGTSTGNKGGQEPLIKAWLLALVYKEEEQKRKEAIEERRKRQEAEAELAKLQESGELYEDIQTIEDVYIDTPPTPIIPPELQPTAAVQPSTDTGRRKRPRR